MKHNDIITADIIDKELYKLAMKSFNNNEIPVGAIVIYNNKIIGRGYNNRQSKNNVCGHAEINAIMSAEKKIKDWRLNDCYIISTLKPCDMCSKIIETARIRDVYYILNQKNVEINKNLKYLEYHFPGNNKTDKYEILLTSFFKNLR